MGCVRFGWCGLLFLALTACSSAKKIINDSSDPVDTSDTDTDTPQSSTGYIECTTHVDCGAGMFCAIECFTGSCGADESVMSGTLGNYCQPCVECEQASDAIDGSCSVCEA